jgi:uncharacterized protein YeaO (DUF488 family)
MIREASTTTLKSLSPEQRASYGLCVLTMRKWPRGLGWNKVNMWIKTAAPSERLLSEWQRGVIGWDMFLACYRAEQACYLTTIVTRQGQASKYVQCSPVAYLARIAQHMPVTVLCWEREICPDETHPRCHRFELVKLIEQEMEVAK